MIHWRKAGKCGAAIAGVALILFGAFACFRSLARYYDAYRPVSDDLSTHHINMTFEISAWAITVAFVLSGIILLRLAKTLSESS
jgi:hypothetical protein